MAMNRQGVFISLTALLIVGSFMIIFTPELTRTSGDAVDARLQNFVQDRASLEEQLLPATIRVHTRRAINSLAQQIVDNEISVTNKQSLEDNLEGCLGAENTFNEDNEHLISTTCGGRSLNQENFIQSMRDIEQLYAQLLQYDINATINTIEIQQVTPWALEITAEVTVFMNDSADFASYYNTRRITTQLPIEGLIDPFSSEKRSGAHTIRRTRTSNWTEDFNNHALRGGYIIDSEGPGYLDRLLGNNNPDEWSFGIHSLIESTGQEVNVSSLDYDDYVYPEECLVSVRLTGARFFHLPAAYMLGYDQGDALIRTNQQYDQQSCEDATGE